MLRMIIVDDERTIRDALRIFLDWRKLGIEIIGDYKNGAEAFDAMLDDYPDIVLTDVKMPGLNGLELIERAHRAGMNTHFVILSGYAEFEFTKTAMKYGVRHYLLKPISYSDFLAAAQKALSWFEKTTQATPATENDIEKDTQADAFFVKSDYKVVRVRFDEVLYIEGLKDYVKIYLTTSPKPLLSLSSMHAVEEHLPKHPFMRIHRSFIVNMNHVEMLERGQIVIGEKHLPISDSYKDSVQDYIRKRMLQGRI